MAVSLALSVGACWCCWSNPFFALLLVPAVHLWILATLVDPPPPGRARMAMVVCGLVPPALLALYELVTLGLDPLAGAWYLFLLVTGGHDRVAARAPGRHAGRGLRVGGRDRPCRRAGSRRARHAPSVRGPASYAGPGSLGGTGSALRR